MRFWNEKYHATPEDGARFDEFGKIFDELEAGAQPGPAAPFLPNDFSYIPALKVRQRVLAAALGSKSAADFRHRAAAFADPSQVREIGGNPWTTFERRLRPRRVATGSPSSRQRFAGIERRVRALGLPGLAAEVSGFLQTRPDSRDYYLHAVPSPEYEGNESTGTSLGNHFCGEMIRRIERGRFGLGGGARVHPFAIRAGAAGREGCSDAAVRAVGGRVGATALHVPERGYGNGGRVAFVRAQRKATGRSLYRSARFPQPGRALSRRCCARRWRSGRRYTRALRGRIWRWRGRRWARRWTGCSSGFRAWP